MHAKTTIAIVSLILSSMGSIHGSMVQAFCSDTGERGLAGNLELACLAIDCHLGSGSDESCANEECCVFDELPTQPLAQHSVPSSLDETTRVAHGLLAVESPRTGTRELLHLLPHGGSPPGPESVAFAGYPLPLLI